MAVGDQASSAGFALVPDTGEDGRVRYGARELNRTRDYVAQVKAAMPQDKASYGAAVGIQRGRIQTSVSANESKAGTLTFPVAFADVPTVQLTVQVGSNFDVLANIQSLSAAGFAWRVFQNQLGNFTGTVFIHWLAIGP